MRLLGAGRQAGKKVKRAQDQPRRREEGRWHQPCPVVSRRVQLRPGPPPVSGNPLQDPLQLQGIHLQSRIPHTAGSRVDLISLLTPKLQRSVGNGKALPAAGGSAHSPDHAHFVVRAYLF